jgi:hypothetical protein|nr:MAG TPA: hypothetical protein [Caudoviricetes sp.]
MKTIEGKATGFIDEYEIVPMADFQDYKVFGVIANMEYIPYTTIRVSNKFFTLVSFNYDSVYNPVLILDGRMIYDPCLWAMTFKYNHQLYALISFNKILPQDKEAIIRQVTGDNEIYSIDSKYESFIKYNFFTEIVWQNCYRSRMYDGGYRIIRPDYVFNHFDKFDDTEKARFNDIFQGGTPSMKYIKNPIQNANDLDKLRFAQKYIKSIVDLKKQYSHETC